MTGQRKSEHRDRFRFSESGGAAIELAVVLPVLILLAIGAAEFGRVYFTAIGVASAARAGAQYGSQSVAKSSDIAGMNLAAEAEAGSIASVSPNSVRTCRCADGSLTSCSAQCPMIGYPEVFVQTTATKTVKFLLKYPGLPDSTIISRTAVFRVQ